MTPSSRGCVKTSLKRPSCALPETRRPDEGIARIDQPLGIVAAVEELAQRRSEEHTSELQSLMRISYAVFCLKKKKKPHRKIPQRANNTTMYQHVRHSD